jgi:hypothetical protein
MFMVSPLPTPAKFTAIWQSGELGEGFPLYHWLKRLFDPFIAEHIYDGKREVVRENAILFDAWVYAHDADYYARFKDKNAFLVHIGDEFYELGVDRYVFFRGVFRMIWSSVFNPKYVFVLPLGSYIKQPPETITPVLDRRYAWSFVGDAEKVSRPDMVRAFSSIEPHVCFSSTPVRGISFFGSEPGKHRIPESEFYSILGDSVFAPSPMGNASIESCRPYDALEVGAIPIVERRLTLDYYKGLLGDHPLPTVSSWAEGRRLANRLLGDQVQLSELHRTCMDWWASYKVRLIEQIGFFLEERSGSDDQLVPLQSRLPNLPLWQYAELLRHHNVPALYRRVSKQAKRLLKQRQWRVSTRRGVAPP